MFASQKQTSILTLPYFAKIIGVCILYVICGKTGLYFASVNPSATAVWLPTAIAFAAFLFFGYRIWPAILLGAFIVNATTTGVTLTSVLIAVGNMLEGLLGAYLINRFAKGLNVFSKVYDYYRFLLLAVLLSTMLSVTVGVTALCLGGFAPWENYAAIWITWWLGDATGALIFTPALLLWATDRKLELSKIKVTEFFILSALTFIIGLVLLDYSFAFSYLVIPILVWLLFRFNPRETATFLAFFSIAMVFAAESGINSLSGYTHNKALIFVQIFVAIVSISIFPLSILLYKQKKDKRDREVEAAKDKRELLSNMAHELRTPLAVIKGNIDVELKNKLNNISRLKNAVSAIDDEIKNLVNIIDKLTAIYSNKDSLSSSNGNYKKIIIANIIEEVIEQLKAAKQARNINIEFKNAHTGAIWGDTASLRSLFFIIIDNAMNYSDNNSTINVSLEKEGGNLKIEIKDEGAGIPEADLPHIFEEFYRSDKSRTDNRAGLGLALAKAIVEAHGGSVSVKSTLGEGSTFTLFFPTAE